MADDTTKTIYNQAEANAVLADSMNKLSFQFAEDIRLSRSWVMIKRLTVGSPFWKMANKLTGINDGFLLYRKNQKKMMEEQKKVNKTLDDYLKVAEKIPKTGLFQRDGTALTDPQAKIEAQKIMEGEEFQGKLAFNQRLKAAGGLRGVDDVEEYTKEQFNKMIELQQDQLDFQMENLVKEEKYREMGFAGKIARKWDEIKRLPRMLGRFLWGGIKLVFTLLRGMFWFVIFAPLVMKVMRWAFKYIQNMTPQQRQKWANARDKIMDIMGAFKDLIVAIWEGRFWDALKIYFGKIVIPVLQGIWTILGMIKNWAFKKFGEFADYVLSGQLKDDIGKAVNEFASGTGKRSYRKLPKELRFLLEYGSLGGLILSRGRQSVRPTRDGKLRNTFASGGTMVNSGMALVGEGGPELVSLPQGARVFSNFASRGMGGTVINVNVAGRIGASDMEIRDIANKVAKEINTHMNRTSSSTVRFG